MQSTLIILISVLGWITAESYSQANCTKNKRDRSFEDSDETVVLYDKDGDICLTARFSIDLTVDEDGFIEDERKRTLELHVQTDHYKGICAGETAFLGNENVTGPAILFAWNERNRENKVLIRWEVSQERTYLNEIKINLTVPFQRSTHKNRYLSAKLGNLHLFPTEIGKPSVDAEELGVYFKDSSKGCLKFRTADYTISVTLGGLSVVTVVVLAIILGVLMALGLMFYHRGSKKRQTNAQPFQP